MSTLEQRALAAYATLAGRCRIDEVGFHWFGEPVPWVGPEAADRAEQLAGHLYVHFYTRGSAVRHATQSPVTRDLQPRYDRSAAAERDWYDGWRVTAWQPTGARITDGRIVLSVAPEDLRPDDRELGPHQVRLPVIRRRTAPGFCLVPAVREPQVRGLVRLYVSVDAAGAPALFETFLRHRRTLPDVQAKVLASSSGFDRLDSFVAYLPEVRLEDAVGLVTDIVRNHGTNLRPVSPALTLPVAPGIALAPEPSAGGSFGTAVCGVLADALLADDAGRIPAALEAAGLRDVPVPGVLRPALARSLPTLPAGNGTGSVAAPTPDAGALVGEVADVLAATALSVGAEATWLWHPPPTPVGPQTALATVGPDRYGGSAGIGDFLVQAARHTGSERHLDVGVRALRHTAGRLAAGWRRHGAYTGSAGAALVVLRVGAEVVGERAVDQARSALLDVAPGAPGWESPDLLSGVAGTLLTVLRARDVVDDPALAARATQLRDRLMGLVDERTGGWPSPDGIALTGFSHGAAGVAYVLHHWLATTCDPDVEVLLARTLAFEDGHFDPDADNWHDLRPWFTDGDGAPRFASVWCHGFPGIALARRAIGADLPRRQDVAGDLDRILGEDGATDPGLCHGLTGLADLADHLGAASPSRLARLLARLQERGPVTIWPESRRDTLRPGLMLGLAGIGDYLLRASSGAGRSPLLP